MNWLNQKLIQNLFLGTKEPKNIAQQLIKSRLAAKAYIDKNENFNILEKPEITIQTPFAYRKAFKSFIEHPSHFDLRELIQLGNTFKLHVPPEYLFQVLKKVSPEESWSLLFFERHKAVFNHLKDIVPAFHIFKDKTELTHLSKRVFAHRMFFLFAHQKWDQMQEELQLASSSQSVYTLSQLIYFYPKLPLDWKTLKATKSKKLLQLIHTFESVNQLPVSSGDSLIPVSGFKSNTDFQMAWNPQNGNNQMEVSKSTALLSFHAYTVTKNKEKLLNLIKEFEDILIETLPSHPIWPTLAPLLPVDVKMRFFQLAKKRVTIDSDLWDVIQNWLVPMDLFLSASISEELRDAVVNLYYTQTVDPKVKKAFKRTMEYLKFRLHPSIFDSFRIKDHTDTNNSNDFYKVIHRRFLLYKDLAKWQNK